MGNNLIVPNPQHRYLEPYKNRVFQYDTAHSNLFLSQYTNQILNAVGNDVIVRGLAVTPTINLYKTGISFEVAAGALIQDQTYFELPTKNTIMMEDLINFPNYYVIIYTNWRYIQTIYENNLKIEATLYNPQTQTSITGWNSATNRVILGVFSYSIVNNEIVFVKEEKDDIYFEDSNIIQNGSFDLKTYKFWTAINSTLKIHETEGVSNTPYLEIIPTADNFQGIAQTINTKINYSYLVSFYIKSEEKFPFKVLVLDGSSMYDLSAPQVSSILISSPQTWTKYEFSFDAVSTKTTLFFLKYTESLENTFEIDSIYCLEYTKTKKQTDINKIKIIDGGEIS